MPATESLSKFFTSETFHTFEDWLKQFPITDSVQSELKKYIDKIKESRWCDDKLRKDYFDTITSILTTFFSQYTGGIKPLTYFIDYIKSIHEVSFQGGYGYYVEYKYGIFEYRPYYDEDSLEDIHTLDFVYKTSPHHFVIRPEHYHKFSEIPPLVRLAAALSEAHTPFYRGADAYLKIAEEPTRQVWGN